MYNCQIVQNSTLARVIAHDPKNKRLRIIFTSGKGYEYPGINTEDFNTLRKSSSIGSFFNSNYRQRTDYQRISSEEVSTFLASVLTKVSDNLIQV